MKEPQSRMPQKPAGAARAEPAPSAPAATGTHAPRFALSAAEAAAAIAASIAGLPEQEALPGEEMEAIVRDGRVQYLPRRRSG